MKERVTLPSRHGRNRIVRQKHNSPPPEAGYCSQKPIGPNLRYLHLDGLRFCFLRLRQMEIQHPILELGFDLLLIDHIGQREGPDKAPVRALDPMNGILSIFS